MEEALNEMYEREIIEFYESEREKAVKKEKQYLPSDEQTWDDTNLSINQ